MAKEYSPIINTRGTTDEEKREDMTTEDAGESVMREVWGLLEESIRLIVGAVVQEDVQAQVNDSLSGEVRRSGTGTSAVGSVGQGILDSITEEDA